MIEEEIQEEIRKCKESPYYFAAKYLTLNGRSFTTMLTEKQFNKYYKDMIKISKLRTSLESFINSKIKTTDNAESSIKIKRTSDESSESSTDT